MPAKRASKKNCSSAGRRLKTTRSSHAGKHLGGPCKRKAKSKKKR